MEGGSVHRMCRCCAAEGSFKDIKTTYHWMGDEEVYGDMLSECFDVKLITSDHGGICEMCITHLRNAANFKKQVLETEEQFRKHLESGKFNRPPVVKQEFTMDDEMGESDDNMDNGEDDDYVPDFEVPIKTEDELDEPVKPRKRACKATTSRAKKSKAEEKNNEEKPKKRILNKAPKELIKQRHNIQQTLVFSNATPIRKHTDKGYVCCFCENQYLDPAELKTHNIRDHTDNTKRKFTHDSFIHDYLIKLDITGLKCNICDEKLDQIEQLHQHLMFKHQKEMYFDTKKLTLPFKFDSETLKCALCGVTSPQNFKMLQLHMNSHFPNYSCNVCNATFVTRAMMMAHKNARHGTEFKCKYCAEVFETEGKRQTHMRTEHAVVASVLPYKCGHCEKRFNSAIQKLKHLASEHDIQAPTYDCQACDRKFIKPHLLKNHQKIDHMMTKRFHCTECSMAFYYENHLRQHSVTHTKAKDFPCTVCGKSYSRKKTLTEHLKIHNNDRRFKCSICEQSFVQKCSWKRHMETKH